MCEFKSFYGDTFLEGREIIDSNIDHLIELEYYKTYTNTEEKRKTIYGVEVIKKEHFPNEVIEESKMIDLLTVDEPTIDKIIKKLQDNKVTPIGLPDVISDML